MYTCMHCSLTDLALILLYGGSVWLPSKATHGFKHCDRLPTSHNNVRQHIMMFPDCIIAA